MADLEKAYFSLLCIGLGTETSVTDMLSLTETQWREIYDLAVGQGTGAFIWDALRQLHVEKRLPLALQMQWAYHVEQIERRYRKQERVVSELSAFYALYSIPLMLLKGYGLSLCYPYPEHRPCGDIDIWLYGKQHEADDLLKRERNILISKDKHHHTVFLYDGVLVENHYDFLNVHAHVTNCEIERLLKSYVGMAGETVRLATTEIHIPPAQFNALFLLRHAAAHFAAERITIRHVTDWVMFIRQYNNKIDWTELYKIARRMNMHRFLNCMNAVSIDFLGLDATLIPSFERDAQLETRMLNDILHPEFSLEFPDDGYVRILHFKFRRWLANSWKHRIVYSENLLYTFFRQVYSHLLKPRSLASR